MGHQLFDNLDEYLEYIGVREKSHLVEAGVMLLPQIDNCIYSTAQIEELLEFATHNKEFKVYSVFEDGDEASIVPEICIRGTVVGYILGARTDTKLVYKAKIDGEEKGT